MVVPRRTNQRAPGLDGVRALAVLAVMAFHEGIPGALGGYLGVNIFFVLSGYLITDLLVAQRARRRGRMDLRGFWTRRARRLLPALAVLLVTVTAAVAVTEPGQLGALRPALGAAATYSSNWYQALHHVSYFATFGPPPPLQHLWSLAIEEQFYLVWPLILGLVLLLAETRRARASIAWLGAAVSALLMAILYTPGTDPSLVYYGTDTHATALLVGSAIALTCPLARMITAPSARLARRLDFVGMAGLAVLAWAVGHFPGADPAVYPAGLVIAALAAAGSSSRRPRPGPSVALLSLPPLRWLGVRSYGIYLWHWPVIATHGGGPGRQPGNAWLWITRGRRRDRAGGGRRGDGSKRPSCMTGSGPRTAPASGCWRNRSRAARRSPMRALPVLATVAAATVACTAGYGVLRPPAKRPLRPDAAGRARGKGQRGDPVQPGPGEGRRARAADARPGDPRARGPRRPVPAAPGPGRSTDGRSPRSGTRSCSPPRPSNCTAPCPVSTSTRR